MLLNHFLDRRLPLIQGAHSAAAPPRVLAVVNDSHVEAGDDGVVVVPLGHPLHGAVADVIEVLRPSRGS